MYDHRGITWKNLKVGVAVTIALGLLFLTVIFSGQLSEFFAREVKIYALFEDVQGIKPGAPVRFSGVKIGTVTSIDFESARKISVTMTIRGDAVKYLKKDSRAMPMSIGLLGDKYVDLSSGTREAPGLAPGDTIAGKPRVDIQDLVQESRQSFHKFTTLVGRLEETLEKIEAGKGTVARLLSDPAIYRELKETSEGLSTLVERVEAGKGNLGRLFREDNLYADLEASVRDIKLFAARLQTSEGSLSRIIEEPAFYERFLQAAASLDDFTRKLSTSRGTLSRLIEDDSLYANLDEASGNLNLLLARIEKGQGLAGQMFKEGELSKELKTTLAELNTLIKDIREHPGKYFSFSLF